MFKGPHRKRNKIWLMLTATALLAASLLAGCSSGSGNSTADSAAAPGYGGAADADTGSADRAGTAEGEALRLTSTSEERGESQSLANAAEPVAAADNAGTAGASGAGLAGGAAFQGKIIYSATLTMQVEDMKASSTELRNAIHAGGGYILQFNDTKHDGEIGASYTIKVPSDGFMPFVDRIAAMPNVFFEQSLSGKDVSEEYVDLESRLKAKQLVEERLLGMMDGATRADDLLRFSDQLGTIQEQIEEIKGRIRYLDSNVAFSTVHLRMYQTDQRLEPAAATSDPSFGARLGNALAGSTKAVVKGLETLLVVLAGALPALVIAAIVLVPIWLALRKSKSGGARPAAAQTAHSHPSGARRATDDSDAPSGD